MPQPASKLVRDLTESQLLAGDIPNALRRFATEFGWRPSDHLDQYPGTERFCNGHLVVEHGLDLTAVISFLRTETPYEDLPVSERRVLLEVSYNNLVPYHLLPNRLGMRVVFTLTDPPIDRFVEGEKAWRAEMFDQLI